MKTEERFREKVAPANADGCWLWTAGTANGYGQFWAGGRHVGAHRYAWEQANGTVPDGLCVLHRCDTPACCNTGHLFLGTQADNIADRDAKGRGGHGVLYGSKAGRAKLTDALAIEVFRATGTLRAIAARSGVGKSQVGDIKNRKRWAHVTDGLS